jgi:hypothetical protein
MDMLMLASQLTIAHVVLAHEVLRLVWQSRHGYIKAGQRACILQGVEEPSHGPSGAFRNDETHSGFWQT